MGYDPPEGTSGHSTDRSATLPAVCPVDNLFLSINLLFYLIITIYLIGIIRPVGMV